MAAKAAEELSSRLAVTGETRSLLERMQTRAELYQNAGLGDGKAWRRLALKSAPRREFVLRLVAPAMRLLGNHGISLRLR